MSVTSALYNAEYFHKTIISDVSVGYKQHPLGDHVNRPSQLSSATTDQHL